MNILWDLRLFSYGYRDRGIGNYCTSVASAILKLRPEVSIFAWGDLQAAPVELRDAPVSWIAYRSGGWKSSIVEIPRLVVRHRIDLIHYWVALGPLRQIGMAPFTAAKTVATVYDLGVELWDIPFCRQIKSEWYWRMQKRFFGRLGGILTISNATLDDIHRVFAMLDVPRDRVLPQLTNPFYNATPRLPYFITLGGAGHKNCARVVAAFATVQQTRPGYRLIVLGALNREEEGLGELPEGIIHEPAMANYETYLRSASGLLFCSLYEGLGLPPLEAMRCGCPLVLSDIAALRETCGDAARFVDPYSVESIAAGIRSLIDDSETWANRSQRGAATYRLLSADAPNRCLRMYEQLTGVKIPCRNTVDDHIPQERQ